VANLSDFFFFGGYFSPFCEKEHSVTNSLFWKKKSTKKEKRKITTQLK
jgi:hypothetical protein